MRAAIFIDRDGTINREVDVLRSITQLRILPGVGRVIKKMNQAGFCVVVITNQPVIARGWISEEYLQEIHSVLRQRLARGGARLDAIYYCPHHPNANLKEYRKKCKCRKPNDGLIQRAAKDMNIDLKKSFMIGDSGRDISAGRKAGLHTILLETGYGGSDFASDEPPHYRAKNLETAYRYIKKRSKTKV